MPIDLDQLSAAARRRHVAVARSLSEAHQAGIRTAFLCHSHKDALYVQGLLVLLEEAGWRIYIDWLDSSMPETPNEKTAANIRSRIRSNDYFLFLATPNSLASRWCPWEIGFADGVKPNERIFVIPTRLGQNYYGNEYIGLYRRIDISDAGPLGAWPPGMSTGGVYVRDL
jgi:hypothetical protein